MSIQSQDQPKTKKKIKLGVIGLSGAGRTSFFSLLAGMSIDPNKFYEMTRDIDNPEIRNLIRGVKLNLPKDRNFRKFAYLLNNLWFDRKFIKRVNSNERHIPKIDARIPIYKKSQYADAELILPMPSGEGIVTLMTIFEEIDPNEVSDSKSLKDAILSKTSELEKQGQRWAHELKAFIEPTDYDGFIILIDPAEDSVLKKQPLLYSLLMLLLPNQQTNNLVTTFLFSKVVYRKLVPAEVLKKFATSYKEFRKTFLLEATNKLLDGYGFIRALLERYGCGKHRKINFGGAFYYDAFCSMKEAPDIRPNEHGSKVIRSINAILPIVHTVHLILGKHTPLGDAKFFKELLC